LPSFLDILTDFSFLIGSGIVAGVTRKRYAQSFGMFEVSVTAFAAAIDESRIG